MAAGLTTEDVGSRVSVRMRLDDGTFGDVVGDLESIGDVALAIHRDGADGPVAVRRSRIVAARVVGPSPRSALELAEISARAWPATDNEWLGRWWLRAAAGYTQRANSVRVLGGPERALSEALHYVQGWYAERALPALLQVVAGSRSDAELARAGWVAGEDVVVMTAGIARVASRLAGRVPALDVAIADEPSPDWLSLFRGGSPPPVARHILTGARDVGFATARGTGPTAIGRAVVEAPWVGLTAVTVTPAARRAGQARAVVAALLGWARMLGARRAYLEVESGNAPAIALYASLGFTEHYRYRYYRPGAAVVD